MLLKVINFFVEDSYCKLEQAEKVLFTCAMSASEALSKP